MNIACYLVSKGKFESAQIPEELVVELSKSLRTKGTEIVQFADRNIPVDGLYIPAKGTTNKLMVISEED